MVFFEMARRGLSHPNTVAFVKRSVASASGGDKPEPVEMPLWGQIIVAITFAAAFLGISLVSYMLDHVLTTLCMVESPTTAVSVRPSLDITLPKKDGEDERLLENGPAIALVNQKPITSSIRRTIRHLKAAGGRAAQFRGLGLYMIYSAAVSISASLFSLALSFWTLGDFLGLLLGATLCARLHAAWTLSVIAAPNNKTLRERIPARQHWKHLVLPTLVKTLMPYFALATTFFSIAYLGFLDIEDAKLNRRAFGPTQPLRIAAVIVVAISSVLFLCIPAIVTLTRIEASLLPEDEDTIIPTDLSFNGAVVPLSQGGSGRLGFIAAWRTFTWEARRRLLKLYVKNFFIAIALGMVVGHVLLLELWLIMGEDMGEFVGQFRVRSWDGVVVTP